jgi:uncharacterized membrane protein YccC
MLTLSTRTKEAIKTALAMTIAYGTALYMDWEKPHWVSILSHGITANPWAKAFGERRRLADGSASGGE